MRADTKSRHNKRRHDLGAVAPTSPTVSQLVAPDPLETSVAITGLLLGWGKGYTEEEAALYCEDATLPGTDRHRRVKRGGKWVRV